MSEVKLRFLPAMKYEDAEPEVRYDVYWVAGETPLHGKIVGMAKAMSGKDLYEELSMCGRFEGTYHSEEVATEVAEQLMNDGAGAVFVFKEYDAPVKSEIATVVREVAE